jgi:cysteine synthase A
VRIVFELTSEGLCRCLQRGNVAGAMRLARELGPGHTVVTILCDSGTRYQSRLFNPEFLKGKSLPQPAWLTAAPRPLPSVFSEPAAG